MPTLATILQLAEVFGVDAAEIVRGVSELYEPVAEEKGITLRAEAPEPAMLKGNRELLSQALANLVDNAIKYAAPDLESVNGSQPEIVVKAAGEGDRILLTVADAGPSALRVYQRVAICTCLGDDARRREL